MLSCPLCKCKGGAMVMTQIKSNDEIWK